MIESIENVKTLSVRWFAWGSAVNSVPKVLLSIANLSKLRDLTLNPWGVDGSKEYRKDVIPTSLLKNIATGCPLLERLKLSYVFHLNSAEMWDAFAKAGSLKTLNIEMLASDKEVLAIRNQQPDAVGDFWSDGMVTIPSLRVLNIKVYSK